MFSSRFLAAHLLAAAAGAALPWHGALAAAQDPAMVQAVVADYLIERAVDFPGTPTVSVAAEGVGRFAACDAPRAFLPPATRLRSRLSVGVRCDGPQTWTTYVQATIRIDGEYFVAAQDIPAGATIGPHQLTTRSGDLLGLSPGTAVLPEEVMGAVATRRIAAGQPVRANALRSAQAVQRGQMVRLVVKGPGFVATGEGQTMADAAPGSHVQVRTASGQLVGGIVRDAGTVEVQM